MLLTAVTAIFLPLTAAELFLTPPENKWVRLGEENVTLVCAASEKIRACSWITPYGKNYPLESGLTAEGGRLQHFAEDNRQECGVLITKVQEKDGGRWRCNVGVVEAAEVKTASGMANLSLAVPPTAVLMEPPFNKDLVNVTAGKETAVVCVVENARPAPVFNWTVNDLPLAGKTQNEELFVDTEGLSTFKQTITFMPTWDQMNQTLRCKVTHPGLITEIDVDTVLSVRGTESGAGAGSLPVGAVVGIVIALLLFLTIAVLLSLLYFRKCGKTAEAGTAADAEEGKQITADESEVEQVPAERPASPAIIDDAPAKNFNQRFVAFLGRLKAKDEKKKLDETTASEFEKIELNDTEVGEEKKDEEKPEEEPKEKVKLSSRVRTFINRFNKKTEKPVVVEGEEEKKEGEEEKKEEAKEEKMEELEPEDKEEKPEEEGEKKKLGSETPV